MIGGDRRTGVVGQEQTGEVLLYRIGIGIYIPIQYSKHSIGWYLNGVYFTCPANLRYFKVRS